MSDEGQREERRFNQEHYYRLVECSKKGDMTEWNEWYEEYMGEQRATGEKDCGAWLEGATLYQAHLKGAIMQEAHLEGANISGAKLQGAHLEGAKLQGAHLEGAKLQRAHLEGAIMKEVHLEKVDMRYAFLEQAVMIGANMTEAHLKRAIMTKTHLKGAIMQEAHLERADMTEAHLEGADMTEAHLEGADMRYAHLEGAIMQEAHLERADMTEAHLEGAIMKEAHLERVDMRYAHLEGASFYAAWLDEKTYFLDCTYDTTTDFTATAITVTRINPNTLTDLQYNIRRKQWEEWYELPKIHAVVSVLKERYKNSWIPKMIKSVQKSITYQPRRVQENISSNKTVDVADGTDKTREKTRKASFFDRIFVNTPVRMFWWISDYGRSTVRIIGAFFGLNLLFTFIYLFLSSITLQFMPQTDPIFNETISFPMALMQSNMIVFSITDVATRGLNELSMFFVLLHIIIGYVLLAALVTRFAIMFQSVGR